MAAPKGNTFAKGAKGAGNPGYGKLKGVLDHVKAHTNQWWLEWEMLMNDEKIENKKYAMTEFNKLQVKLIPTDIESGGQPLVIKFDPTFHVITQETTGDSDESSEI